MWSSIILWYLLQETVLNLLMSEYNKKYQILTEKLKGGTKEKNYVNFNAENILINEKTALSGVLIDLLNSDEWFFFNGIFVLIGVWGQLPNRKDTKELCLCVYVFVCVFSA